MCPHEECCHDDELRLECFIEGIVFINLEIAFFGINPFLNGILSVLSQVVVRLSTTIVFRPLSKNKVWDTKNWYKNWIKGMNNLIGKSRERECWDLTNVCFFFPNWVLLKSCKKPDANEVWIVTLWGHFSFCDFIQKAWNQ